MATLKKTAPKKAKGTGPWKTYVVLAGLLALGLTIQWTMNRPATAARMAVPDQPAHTNNLLRTPPMGFNTWNKFECKVSDGLIRQIADAMVESGMKDAGYEYLVIDDCWMAEKRVKGHLQADPSSFPYGIRPLADYVHARGLKFGLYMDHGRKTCQGRAGSYGHEKTDAADLAAWGVDYLKYDNCNLAMFSKPQKDYNRMKRALANSGRAIAYSICAWKFEDWMPQEGNLWRTTGDISDKWESMLGNADENDKYASFAGPGHWNDPDMLEIGNGGMTDDEYRAHMSFWAVMAAPLFAGNDVRSMTQATKDILLNKEVIAVDQDPLGIQGKKVWEGGDGYRVYTRVLQGENVRAVVLLNTSSQAATLKAEWKDLSLSPGPATVRDLWAHEDRGVYTDAYSTKVPAHGAAMLKITSVPKK